MAFDKYVAPTLPLPPKVYDTVYFTQLLRAIQNYFTVIGSPAAISASIVTPTMLRTPVSDLTLVNGNNDNIALPPHTFFRITGPTAGFDIRGINSSPQNTNDGRQIIIFNPTANNMTIHNEEVTVTAENRINTCTAANINISGTGVVSMIYSVKDLRWIVMSHEG